MGVDVEEEEHRARNGGAGGGGRVHGELWCPSAWGGAPTTRGRGLRGVEMTLENFNPCLAFIPVVHHYWL